MKAGLPKPGGKSSGKARVPPKHRGVSGEIISGISSKNASSCACGGSCPKCQAKNNGLQTKLAIGKPGDAHELEADRVADQIVGHRSDFRNPVANRTPTVSSLQRKAASNTETRRIPASVSNTLSHPGHALDRDTRSNMESHFEKNFGSVRIHTGSNAARSSSDVNAKAYTVGNDIVFNENQYSPGTKEGDRLLAHELTHVVQQSGVASRNILQRDAMDEPIALNDEDEEGGEGDEGDEDEGNENENEEDEDTAEDGDNDVSDVTEYPEQPDLPEEDVPEPLPVNPGDNESVLQQGIDNRDSGAEEMKGGGKNKKIKKILVDQPTQLMTITFTDGKVKTHGISTGRGKCGTKDDPCKSQNSHNCTPNGTFTIVGQGTAKTKNSHGDAMAWFVGLKVPGRSGIGIHNSQPVPGTPRSHGCVRTGNATQDGGVAEMINSGVTYGKTKVTIQGKAKTKAYPCPAKKTKKKSGGKGKKSKKKK